MHCTWTPAGMQNRLVCVKVDSPFIRSSLRLTRTWAPAASRPRGCQSRMDLQASMHACQVIALPALQAADKHTGQLQHKEAAPWVLSPSHQPLQDAAMQLLQRDKFSPSL